MALQKQQKIQFVSKLKKELADYKTVAIMPINGVPDRLFQKVRNRFRGEAKVIVARKNLLKRVIEKTKFSVLEPFIIDNVALILSNKEPGELYKAIMSNRLRLAAKPSQIASSDISISAGETAIAPGQAVTELKAADINVQIQAGKVVISKGKVLVEKGKKITRAVAKALKLLEVMPFEAAATLNVAFSDNLLFTKEALSTDEEAVRREIAKAFAEANSLSTGAEIITQYNVNIFIVKAYRNAYALGTGAKVPEPEFTAILIGQAALGANALSGLIKTEEAKTEEKSEIEKQENQP